MNLAKYYHKVATEVFLNAIRSADRFHVNLYLFAPLQSILRQISQGQSLKECKLLKQYKNVLSIRFVDIESYEITTLNQFLTLSDDLIVVYGLKEELII